MERSYLDKCMAAMTYEGGRFGRAWSMAVATYAYTRAHDGDVINDSGDTISFSRWYCFCCAVSLWWEYVRK